MAQRVGGSFSRRQVLGFGLLGGVAVFGGAAVLASCSSPAPVVRTGLELVNPPVRRATDGRIGGSLVAKIADVDVGIGRTVRTYPYDGALPGSPWELWPGQSIGVELRNELPPVASDHEHTPEPIGTTPATETNSEGQTFPTELTRPHAWTTTNLHTHGLHVSPEDTEAGAGDNVLLVIQPGTSEQYDIRIPDNHTGGLFWYHPHVHGGVKQQVRGGMAGAIIIRGAIDEVPEVAAATEKILVLQDLELSKEFALQEPTPADPNGNYWPDDQEFWVINGQYRPVITMRPGEVQRWRIVNAAASWSAQLTVDGHPLNVLAYDGYTLARPEEDESTTIVPGGRVDLLIKAGSIGSYDIELLPANDVPAVPPTPDSNGYTASNLLSRVIATVRIEGEPLDMSLPTTLPAFEQAMLPQAKTRTLNYDSMLDASGNFLGFMVGGHPFDPSEPPYQMQLGTSEEWTIDDLDGTFTHIFHIHINPFLVTEVNGVPLATPQWRDTFALNPGGFTMQMNLADFTGKYVDHCHYVDHEDMGMMELVEVVA